MDVHLQVRRALMPHFVLQPVVEAIMTGHDPIPGKSPGIVIIARKEAESLMIVVTGTSCADSLPATEAQNRDGALEAVRERMRQQFGNAQSSSIENSPDGSVRITLLCPFIEKSMPSETPAETGSGT